MEKTPEQLSQEREKRINDTIQLKVPDRVPIVVLFALFPAKYAGITCEEAMYDYNKMMKAWVKTMGDFQPDAYDNPFPVYFLGRILEALDCKQLKWPGHGVDRNLTYQFIEGEYMKAEEYDAFLSNLSDYMIRTHWPRIFGALESFKTLPPPHELMSYYMGLIHLTALDKPETVNALESLLKAAAEVRKMVTGAHAYAEEMKRLGIPPQFGGFTQAPFDTISDFFRGTRGAMLDMYRTPDKLLEVLEKILPIMIEMGVRSAKRTGIPRVFIPLHKGGEYFMSQEQFKVFYWPGLRKLMLGLIDNELIPCPLFEGDYTSRLEMIGDIPKGKACYAFECTDIFKAKEELGNHICIRGNVPLSLLCTGTPQQVKDYCRKLIDVVGKRGGYIMDAGAGLDEAKPENVKAMFDFTKEYGVYK
jgi:uroporphyrinogen-III decarboxylase